MLNLPKTTEFGRRVPKQKFYEHLDVSLEVKRLFVEQIKLITWANKLSPQTMNLAAGQAVTEIEVFHIKLTGQELDRRAMELMDKQIPYHILFLLERPDGALRLAISYKEAAQSGDNAFRLRQSYATDWQSADGLTLPLTALDMDGLYEVIVRVIAGDLFHRGDQGQHGYHGAAGRGECKNRLCQGTLRGHQQRERDLRCGGQLRKADGIGVLSG